MLKNSANFVAPLIPNCGVDPWAALPFRASLIVLPTSTSPSSFSLDKNFSNFSLISLASPSNSASALAITILRTCPPLNLTSL